jgi:putative aldouronate transport system substrate-binding protein
MYDMKKRGWLALLLVLVLALAACTNNGASDAEKPSEAPEQQAEQPSTKEPEAAALPENFNAEGFPIVKEPITLKLMGAKHPIQGAWDQLKLFKVLTEKTGIQFEFDTPAADSYAERKNLAFASGQLPDFFFGGNLTTSDEVTYGQQGYLVPLEDLIEKHAPTIQAMFEADPEIKQSITATDGHIYALPMIRAGFGLYPKLWISKEWMDKLGMQMPTTTDEFYNVLKAFKEQDPNGNGQADEIPITMHKFNVRPAILAAFGYVSETVVANDPGSHNIDIIDDKAVYIPIQEGYKEYLAFMKKLYEEGLLDPESFTQNPQQIIAKGKEGRLGAFNQAGPFLAVGPENNTKYVQLQPLTSSVSSEPTWLQYWNLTRGTFAITKNNPHPEATIRLVDYLYSQEGSLLTQFGVEGEDWKANEFGGYTRITPEGLNPEEYRGGQVTPAAGTPLPFDIRDLNAKNEGTLEKTNPQGFHIWKETNEKLVPHARYGYPLVYFTNEEQKQLNVLETDIKTYVEQMEAKFITGGESLDNWDTFVSTVERMGLEDYVKTYQAAYDRWKAAE